MATKRYKKSKALRRKTIKMRKVPKTGKKWVTAIEAAQNRLEETGSITAAKEVLRKQALTNARKLFGSVGV